MTPGNPNCSLNLHWWCHEVSHPGCGFVGRSKIHPNSLNSPAQEHPKTTTWVQHSKTGQDCPFHRTKVELSAGNDVTWFLAPEAFLFGGTVHQQRVTVPNLSGWCNEFGDEWSTHKHPPPRMPVTTTMMALFVEDPYKPSFFATVSGKGSIPRRMWPWLKSNLVHPHTILAAMNPENCWL